MSHELVSIKCLSGLETEGRGLGPCYVILSCEGFGAIPGEVDTGSHQKRWLGQPLQQMEDHGGFQKSRPGVGDSPDLTGWFCSPARVGGSWERHRGCGDMKEGAGA